MDGGRTFGGLEDHAAVAGVADEVGGEAHGGVGHRGPVAAAQHSERELRLVRWHGAGE